MSLSKLVLSEDQQQRLLATGDEIDGVGNYGKIDFTKIITKQINNNNQPLGLRKIHRVAKNIYLKYQVSN